MRAMLSKVVVVMLLLVPIAAASAAKEPVIALDFGPANTPVGEGFRAVSRDTAYDATAGYGWTKPPVSDFDYPHSYPLDAISRDGVGFNSKQAAELRIDLPNGDYVLELLMGTRSPYEWRPHMIVSANGKPVLSGLMGTGGTPAPARAEVTVTDGKLLLTFGNRFEKAVSGSLNGLTLRPRQEPMLQLYRHPAADKLRPAVRWVADEKIRMMYGGAEKFVYDADKGYYVDVSEAFRQHQASLGINCMIDTYTRELGRDMDKQKVRLFHHISYGSGELFTLVQDKVVKNVVAGRGEDNRPSPTDANAWRMLAVDEALRAYRQSVADGTPIAGVSIDLEMYGAKYMEVYTNACTFDDPAYFEFWQGRSEQLDYKAPAPEKRFDFLAQHNLLQDYYRFLEGKIEQIARGVREQIHAEAPDLLIGFLQYMDNWFYRGFVRGLGTAEMPVIAFTENTYYGYGYNAPYEHDYFRVNGQHALYVPGFWPRAIHPESLGPQVYAAGVESDGFWFFGYRQTSEANLPAVDTAIRTASAKLTETLKTGQVDRAYQANHELAPLELAGNDPVTNASPVDADRHATKLVPLPDFADATHKFDFGQPTSGVKEGWTKVVSVDLYDASRGWGWERLPRFSFNRTEHNSDPLLADGIVAQGKNVFTADVPAPGTYKVSVILGDPSPGEWRTHQNVRANGVTIATDITTNGGEYRLFDNVVEADKAIRIELEGRGAQRYVTIHGIVVTPVKP